MYLFGSEKHLPCQILMSYFSKIELKIDRGIFDPEDTCTTKTTKSVVLQHIFICKAPSQKHKEKTESSRFNESKTQ